MVNKARKTRVRIKSARPVINIWIVLLITQIDI